MRWSEARMQFALTRAGNLFDYTRYAVVPNVSWGLGLSHEADLLCLSNSGVFHEVEIKVTLSDLKADARKRHGHYSVFIKNLWYAVPDILKMHKVFQLLPVHAGLVVVTAYGKYKQNYHTSVERRPRPKRNPRFESIKKPSVEKVEKFLRLGVMRMWTDTERFKCFEEIEE